MNTEITDIAVNNGCILFDGECSLCTGTANRLKRLLEAKHFTLLPLQTPWIREKLEVPETELLKEMRLLKPDGQLFGGVDAVVEIARQFTLLKPLCSVAGIPIVRRMLCRFYAGIARRRNCTNSACTLQRNPKSAVDFLPLLILPFVALGLKRFMAPWEFMWAMAFALYAGSKWLTFRKMTPSPPPCRSMGYLFGWPGMNTAEFFDTKTIPTRPKPIEWLCAAAKTGFGAFLVWKLAAVALPENPLLAGWIGMIGCIFVLHFGLFQILSLCWRRAGLNTTPVMRNPLLSRSVAEFWGERWNTAFNQLAFTFTYRPLRRRLPPAAATITVFGISGALHELVISLPANGGYGLPTAYFLLQGMAVAIERSPFGACLGHGWRGRAFAISITAIPAFWLFHPAFVQNVIQPMLNAIGAT